MPGRRFGNRLQFNVDKYRTTLEDIAQKKEQLQKLKSAEHSNPEVIRIMEVKLRALYNRLGGIISTTKELGIYDQFCTELNLETEE